MQTDDLIKNLAGSVAPVADGWLFRRLALVFSAGLLIALIGQWQTQGVRGDVTVAWVAVLCKVAFCVGMGAVWLRFLRVASAPGAPGFGPLMLGLAGLAVMILLAALSSLEIEPLYGCVEQVLILGLPAFLGLFWVVRAAAPVSASGAGFALGIAAGAIGAFGYSFGCDVDVPTTVAFRYGTAILISGALGGLLGRFLLRW